jgi:hypothetical protein
MARELTSMDALVVGIDITHYLKELEASPQKCVYPAAELETLSHFIQKKLGFPEYHVPVLAGYSSGATLVYAVLVQAPPTPSRARSAWASVPTSRSTSRCARERPGMGSRAQGEGSVVPALHHAIPPWVALQGLKDQICDPPATEAYVKKVQGGEIVTLPKVGHGFSVPGNWMPQLRGRLHADRHFAGGQPRHPRMRRSRTCR